MKQHLGNGETVDNILSKTPSEDCISIDQAKEKIQLTYKNLINKCEELKNFDLKYFISKLDIINDVCSQIKLYYNKSVDKKTHKNNIKVLKELKLFKPQIISVLEYIDSFKLLVKLNNYRINKLTFKIKEYKSNSILHEKQCENYITQLNELEDNNTKLERQIIILDSQIDSLKITKSQFNKLKHKYINSNKFFLKLVLFLLFINTYQYYF